MRAGGCTLQRQALTAEAAAVVKQAINLARRRGHAQVTPLHVANTMLSSPTGLLRAACLQSHSHPLQCKALELCFNVALNRLPASTLSSPMLAPPHSHHHHHHYPPSLSNALIAAFKRAQAHQRRGSIESQQQPLLAVKIELEQLVISILDDPSVSRVMREAGFSSTQVKSNVEQAVSMEVSASPTPPNRSPARLKDSAKTRSSALAYQARNEDVMAVLYALAARRKRSTVVVGETLAAAEAVVGGVMEKLNKGEVDPEVLRNVQFITLPLFSFRQMALEEVDHKVGELKSFVRSCCGGVVLYLKDLDWAAEFRASRGEKGRSYYCPLEHVIMEIRSLFCGGFEGAEDGSERIWLMAVATHQTYTRCRSGNPSLETLWQLEPLTIPDGGGLGLSLNCDSGLSQMRSKTSGGDAQFLSPTEDEIGSSHLSCCVDCDPVDLGSTDQTQSTNNTTCCGSHRSMSSNLPSWLQRYKEESSRANSNDNQGYLQLKDLCRRNHNNHPSEITFSFSSVSPSSSSISFSELYQNQQQPLIPHHFWVSETADECPEPKSTAAGAYPNSNPNASSASGAVEMGNFAPKFKELNAENLKTLCSSLEKRSTWQQDIIPEIASTVLQCRSGLMRRKRKHSSEKKEDTWLFFQGSDAQGKERIARELAKLVFGSYTDYLAIGLSSFSSTRSDSTEEGGGAGSKRSRSEASQSYMDRLYEAVRENPHRVIVMGDIEQVDCFTHAGIKRAIERGRLRSSGDEEVGIGDAIVILSCESFDSRSRACSPQVRQKSADSAKEKEDDEAEEEEGRVGISLDLNLCAEEEDLDTEDSFENEGLVESVDRAFFFNLPEDL